MKTSEFRKLVKEEIYKVIKEDFNNLNEGVGEMIGYAALAIILGGSAYLTYIKNMGATKNVSTNTGELNPFLKKILNKVAPDWMRNREIKKIALKLSKIPEVMELVNQPGRRGLRELIMKYLSEDEMQYILALTRTAIKGVVKEAKPSAFMSNKFPSVIEYDNQRFRSEIRWSLISSEKLDMNKIGDFQAIAGYAPQGYGGPYELNEEELEDGTFKYTWHCFASSD